VRRLRLVALGLCAAFVIVMMPTSAQAITPSGPLPMTGIPSVGAKTLPTTGGPAADRVATFMYMLMSSATTANYAPAKAAGTATPAQLEALKTASTPVKYPAGATALAKGTGAAAVLLGGFQLGSLIGSTGAELAGLDPNGAICSVVPQTTTGQMLAYLQGQTCDFSKINPQYTPNTDAKAGLSMAKTCSKVRPDQGCMQFVGESKINDSLTAWCLKMTDGAKPGTTLGVSYSWRTAAGVEESSAGSSWIYQQDSWCPGVTDNVSYALSFNPGATPTGFGFSTDGTLTPVTQSTANPSRQLKCTVTAGGQTFAGTPAAAYTETDKTLNLPTCPVIPNGLVADTTSVSELGTDAEKQIWKQDTPAEVKEVLTAYPECADGTCTLELIKVKDGTQTRCFDSPEACADWYTDPKKADNYSCRYGSHTLDLAECTAYAPTFKIQGKTVYGDPTTGMPAESPVKPDEAACFGGGWTSLFSPSWIVDGVSCALGKAFIPDPDFVTLKTTGLSTTWATSGPGALSGIVGAWDFHPTATGCEGLTIDWGSVFGHNAGKWHLLAACPGDPLASVKDAGWYFLALVFAAGGALGAYRIVGSTIKIARVG
jgi:hypothetical protein